MWLNLFLFYQICSSKWCSSKLSISYEAPYWSYSDSYCGGNKDPRHFEQQCNSYNCYRIEFICKSYIVLLIHLWWWSNGTSLHGLGYCKKGRTFLAVETTCHLHFYPPLRLHERNIWSTSISFSLRKHMVHIILESLR